MIKILLLLAAMLAPASSIAQVTQSGAPNPGPSGVVGSDVAICDPSNPANCLKPNPDGSLNIDGISGGSGGGASTGSTSGPQQVQGVSGGVPVNTFTAIQPVDVDGVPFATYAITFPNVVIAAGMTDFLSIQSSSTKKVELLKVKISATSGALAVADLILVKRSTVSVGGTLVTISPAAPTDSNDIAPSATVKLYSASPTTLGTLVGNIDSMKLTLDTTTAPSNGIPAEFVPANGGKPWVLNGANGNIDVYALNWAAQATAATADVTLYFREH